MASMTRQAEVRLLGTFKAGSYGYGSGDAPVDLYYIDCPEFHDARRAGSIQPWVYGSEADARRHLSGSSVLVGGHGTGRKVVAGPDLSYRMRAAKVGDYPHRNDVTMMAAGEARRLRPFA